MMTAVIRLEVADDYTSLLERRATKALDLLCDAVSSPAAQSSGLSEGETINAIKKLRLSSLDEPEYDEHEVYDPYCTPVWNVSSKQELEQVGLDLTEIEGLASILPFGESSNETDVSDQVIPEILFTLEVLDYDENKFRRFMSRLDGYPAVGVLLCELLTDSKLLEKAQQFLGRESTDQKREILFEYLKENLTNLSNRNITHFVSSCGKHIATIVPKEINSIELWIINDSDTTALATVISHSSVVKKLEFSGGLDSNSLASFQDGLKNSDVKIRSLDISDNEDTGEEGFRCLGNIVKKHTVEEVNMFGCGLSFGKLKSFNDASGNAKIRSLNISYNKGIDEEGFCWLGNIVKKHAVEELTMTNCNLSCGKLKSFNDTSGNAKIRSLDISDNENTGEEGFRCLGNIVKKHAVEELNMYLSGLSCEKLKSFDDASGNAKIRSLDISYNRDMDEEGFRCLGNIVKKHAVEELDMSECGLSFGKMKSFDDGSGNAKIKVLDISVNKFLTVNAICQLTLKVTDRLTAKRCLEGWREQDIQEVQDFIHTRHPGGLKVTLGDGLPELWSGSMGRCPHNLYSHRDTYDISGPLCNRSLTLLKRCQFLHVQKIYVLLGM